MHRGQKQKVLRIDECYGSKPWPQIILLASHIVDTQEIAKSDRRTRAMRLKEKRNGASGGIILLTCKTGCGGISSGHKQVLSGSKSILECDQ